MTTPSPYRQLPVIWPSVIPVSAPGASRADPAFEHTWASLVTGWLFPGDEFRRSSVIRG